ncbi:RRP15-like protein [Anopheles maculipalpis]|uniref:RRP15-like protein n=1 Tax=Anopheles maculipalpis TaxID=1496333 RepID=UPI002158F914|nr:RRP15-like protein [Anopheles maculipalpis]
MMKPALKKKLHSLPAPESDSDSLEDDDVSGDDGEEFLSDEEYPMSEDELDDTDGEGDDGVPGDGAYQSGETTKWAKAMAKFLRKAPDANILSKVTTDEQKERQKKQTKEYEFDVVSAEGTVEKEADATKSDTEEKPTNLKLAQELLRQRAALKKLRQKDILGLRVRPSIHDHERERTLRKVATKGTVQLFNAVRQQQKEVNRRLEEAGKLEYKRDKVLKSLNRKEFLDVLMSGPRAKSELVDNLVKKEEDEDEDGIKSEVDSEDEPKSTWGALRADFLTGKKSGWDKEEEEGDKIPDNLDEDMESGSDM